MNFILAKMKFLFFYSSVNQYFMTSKMKSKNH